MSRWTIAEPDDCDWDEQDQSLNVWVEQDNSGNVYVQVPLKILKEKIPAFARLSTLEALEKRLDTRIGMLRKNLKRWEEGELGNSAEAYNSDKEIYALDATIFQLESVKQIIKELKGE